ncbi:hypothetical protein ACLIYM_22530 [Streptomyces fenghuangensis]|uniref:hypothetical protein n=1 Tax=Streptomyces sp. ICN903 TaxID=2964654 RepID=UPI001EDC4C64|nr:hypothetical protein [Streptomyces sp. ICN903]MCG3043621.1 hypothetical protein [Streptomyces sp. ICN903]
MRSTAVRRTALAASAACLALLATACGGSDSGGGDEEKAKAGQSEKSSSAGPAAGAKTSAELEKLVLADGDVEGHKVEKLGAGDSVSAKEVSSDKDECAPLAHAQLGVPLGDPAATAQRIVTQEPEKPADGGTGGSEELTEEDLENFEDAIMGALDATTTMVTLSSYEDGGAQKALADLRTAAESCSGGFTGGVKGDGQKVTGIEEEKVTGGEEAAAWTVTSEQEGEKVPLKLAVVRQGATLAVFSSFNIAAAGNGEDFDLPTAVIEAQTEKLG